MTPAVTEFRIDRRLGFSSVLNERIYTVLSGRPVLSLSFLRVQCAQRSNHN